jgi:type I restriction enzyme S subunit
MSANTQTLADKEEAKPALVPNLRFPEFRDADGWGADALGDVAHFVNEKVPLERVALENYVSTENILPDYGGVAKASKLPILGSVTRYRPNDTLLSNIRPYLKKVWVADKEGGASNDVIVMRAKESLSPQYFSCLLKNDAFIDYVMTGAKGVKMPRGDVGSMKAYRTLYPSKAEQQKIAECLSSVDDLITAQARKLNALKTHKKGLMQQLFPREGETQPRLRFPEFQSAGGWEASPLSKFILSLDAGVSVNSGDSRAANGAEFGVLKTSAITKGQFDPEENKVVLAESEISRLREPVTGGSIIMCRKNTPALVGANAYVESTHENLFLPDLLWAAKPREGVSMRCLAFILGSEKGRAGLSKLAKGSSASMSNITKPEVLAFSVMAPSLPEQQRIATFLSNLDTLVTAEAKKLVALKTHKKGLMQQLFPSPEAATA